MFLSGIYGPLKFRNIERSLEIWFEVSCVFKMCGEHVRVICSFGVNIKPICSMPRAKENYVIAAPL